MISMNVELLADCLEELKPLLEEHWEEIAAYKDVIEFCPDYEKYLTLEELDMVHTIVVRDEGKVVGYCIAFLHPNLHYSKDLYAVNDIVFIHPDYRGSTVAYRMFKFAEKCYRELGCSVMTVHMKCEHPFEKLAKGLGMDKMEYLFTKCLKEN